MKAFTMYCTQRLIHGFRENLWAADGCVTSTDTLSNRSGEGQ